MPQNIISNIFSIWYFCNNNNYLRPFDPGRPVPEETFTRSMKNLLGFVEQRKKMEAEAPTVQVGATPTELVVTPPP